MDGEFAPMRNDLAGMGIKLNMASANEHVPMIERQIRTIKERVRSTRHSLPFKIIPVSMLVELVYFSTMWLNAFPPSGGVSENISPRWIMTGVQFDYTKHCKLPFGSYVQAHEEPSPSNTQAARTVGAICFGPTGNLQGSYKFLNLRTGRIITRRNWTDLPMPQEVIDRVNALGRAEGQPELLTFFYRRGLLIGDLELPGVADNDEPQEQNVDPYDDKADGLEPPAENQDFGLADDDVMVEDVMVQDDLGARFPYAEIQDPQDQRYQPQDTTGTEIFLLGPEPTTVPEPATTMTVQDAGVGRPQRTHRPPNGLSHLSEYPCYHSQASTR